MGWMFSKGSAWLRMKVSVCVRPIVDVLLLELMEHSQVQGLTTIPCCCIPLQTPNWKQPSGTSEVEHTRQTAGFKM